MKKRLIIISLISVLVILILFIVFLTKKNNNQNYTVVVSLIDNYSPDRLLTVYNEKNQKLKVKRVEYENGKLICQGDIMAVHYVDIESITK